MKIKLRHKDFCDGCLEMAELHTLAQHKRCNVYKKNMLPRDDVFLANRGLGYLPRPEICKNENETEISR